MTDDHNGINGQLELYVLNSNPGEGVEGIQVAARVTNNDTVVLPRTWKTISVRLPATTDDIK